MPSLNRSKEDEMLIAYLREAAPALAGIGAGPHPATAALAAYCRNQVDEETSQHIRDHLFHCEECFAVAHHLEQVYERERDEVADEVATVAAEGPYVAQPPPAYERAVEKILSFVLTRLQPLAVPLASTEPLGMAAASQDALRFSSETWREGELEVTLSVDADKHLLATCEIGGLPCPGANVLLVEVVPDQTMIVRASGRTNTFGDADLGELDKLNPAARPGQYLIQVRFPRSQVN
jgi:hypothetical protein